MDKNEILEISKDVENKPNKVLFESLETLSIEFEKTKELIVDLTRHLDAVEDLYNIINNEIGKRTKK